MANEQSLVMNFELNGITVNGNIEFFRKVIEHPHIVIARKENDRNTTVSYFGKFPLQSDEPFGNCVFVFKPKVEDITHEVNTVGFMFYFVKPAYNSFFAC